MEQEIEDFIHLFNQKWTEGKLEGIDSLLHSNSVFVAPDMVTEIIGREPCIASLKEYSENVETLSFKVTEKKVHLQNNTAMVTLFYDVAYKMNGTVYREEGVEFWNLIYENSSWLLLWRALASSKEKK